VTVPSVPETTPPLPDPYRLRVRTLAGRLHAHFAAAVVKRGLYQTPSELACFKLAQTLLTVENGVQNFQRPQEQARVKAVRALRRAAKLVQPVRDDFARIAEHWDNDAARATVGGIDRLLGEIDWVEPRLWGSPHDPAIFIADAARAAWASANGGEYPTSADPETPLVRFVCAALGEIGLVYAPSTISDVLKGKRKRAMGRKKIG
jgi:hypothetical protein